VLANWQLWIPFQFLNFYFVPQKFQVFEDALFISCISVLCVFVASPACWIFFQVLAANFVALAWNVILSFKAHKEVIAK
jgi:peroxisomal membrane protein 2